MSAIQMIEYSTSEFPKDKISRREILRYMGCKESSPETEILIDKGFSECLDKLSYKVVYSEYQIKTDGEILDLGFAQTKSKNARKALENCNSIILFAATIGLEIDRQIMKYGRFSPSLALCIQAIGAERIEALCDRFSLDMKEKFAPEGKALRPRFSAGYGDLPLEFQRDIFSALACEKNIGLTLNNSFLMSPTKSVTAVIGIQNPYITKEKQ